MTACKNIVNLLRTCLFLANMSWFALSGTASEQQLTSPDGKLVVTISDDQGLSLRAAVDGQSVLTRSRLGLEFKDGTRLGPQTAIIRAKRKACDDTWDNPLGNRRRVRNHYQELRLTLQESNDRKRTFGLVVRAYNDGIAFRYDLPKASGLGDFVLTNELTEFRFADNYRCWSGEESACAENHYPERRLSDIPAVNSGHSYQSVLPLLAETPVGYFAIAESDLLDWSGISLTGTGTPAVKVTLDPRSDRNGLVVSSVPRLSPWRVLMFGRSAAALADSDLIANLASPSHLREVSWIKPGACAWDPWWTGINPHDADPKHTGVFARGTTPADKEYIDFAAEMGWPYQMVDWFWYKNMTLYNKSLHSPPNELAADFTSPVAEMDIPELIRYAKTKGVRLLIWAHSLDVQTFGVERALDYFAAQGFAGVKIDFINSQSQETVQWCEQVLVAAAKRHLLIDFHGTYKPTGLARTYPNFITQEGVLGNEYNKLGKQCTPLHTVTLPFTRALLGPMDFTPGGFLNCAPTNFQVSVPATVIGTRARQLAMTVIYPSPLLVLCDSPRNYRGQPGIEFLRKMPTVWDETVTLAGEVGKYVVTARRSGDHWYLAAMNGDDPVQLQLPLKFLGPGRWLLRAYADPPQPSDVRENMESNSAVNSETALPLSLSPAGGFAGILSKLK